MKKLAALALAAALGLTVLAASPADARRDTDWPCPGCKVIRFR